MFGRLTYYPHIIAQKTHFKKLAVYQYNEYIQIFFITMKLRLAFFGIFFFLTAGSTQAFFDLPDDHAYHFALTYLQQEGIINGYPDGSVKPDQSINRAELVKILVEGLGHQTNESVHRNCFPDVGREWFAKYVCYALEKNWVQGHPDGNFRPSDQVNKAEAMKIILNAFGISISSSSNTLPFTDVSQSDWFYNYLTTAHDRNLIEEAGNSFWAGNARTRGEVAEMVSRVKQILHMDDPVYNDAIRAEFQTLLLVNKIRRDFGINEPLVLNRDLTRVAREHSRDMAEVIGNMSHQGSDGSQSQDRIRAAIAGNIGTGENVGMGTVSQFRSVYQAVEDIHVNVFLKEPDGECNHKTTILSRCLPFTEVGIGIYVKDGKMYFTQDFLMRVE